LAEPFTGCAHLRVKVVSDIRTVSVRSHSKPIDFMPSTARQLLVVPIDLVGVL